MTKEEFISWRSDPVTKRVFEEIETLIQNGTDELSVMAGENPIMDAKRVGKIAGLRDILGISFYELEGEHA